MPLFLVDKTILDTRHEIVVCPYRCGKEFLYEDIDELIYEKANKKLVEKEFYNIYDCRPGVIFTTRGYNLCDYILHVVVPDWVYDENFEKNIFRAYVNLISLIRIKKYKDVVLPILKFSYKRVGNKNSYRTAKILLKYLMTQYDLNDVNIYLLTDTQTIEDHLNDYVSTYVSTSWPLSKRHKPRAYKLNTNLELKRFRRKYSVSINTKNIPVNRYYDIKRKFPFEKLYNYIRTRYRVVRNMFCYYANFSFERYCKTFKYGFYPTKNELLGMCVALRLTYDETKEIFDESPYELELNDERDCLIISHIVSKKYNVHDINELLFIKGLPQIGSNLLFEKQEFDKIEEFEEISV